jgi:uncharacterized protein YbjT (DUF2867 family)
MVRTEMQIAVAGGSGTLGREVVAALARRGHAVRALSRGAREYPVDLVTGEGLEAALDGVEVVIDASNAGPGRAAARAVLVDGGRRLLAAERAAGVRHHVAVSIVGIDRVPYPYFEVKLAQEAVVREGGVPWSILRATQFHTLLSGAFAASARYGLLPGLHVPLQPVDPSEVAAALAGLAEDEPSHAITEFAGPQIRSVADLARTYKLETGRHAVVLPVSLPGRTGRALASGSITSPGAWGGRIPFAEWVRSHQGRPEVIHVPVGSAA